MQKTKLMKLRKTVAIMATAAMTMSMPVTALAAPAAYTQSQTVSQDSIKSLMNIDLHPIFDAAVYAADNQDVVSQVGDSPEALYNHFITEGINQNRKFNSKFSMNDIRKLLSGYANQFGNNNRLYLAMLLQKMAQEAGTTVQNITADQVQTQLGDVVRTVNGDVQTLVSDTSTDKTTNNDNNKDDNKDNEDKNRPWSNNWAWSFSRNIERNQNRYRPPVLPVDQDELPADQDELPVDQDDHLQVLQEKLDNFWDTVDTFEATQKDLSEKVQKSRAIADALQEKGYTVEDARQLIQETSNAHVEAVRAYDKALADLEEAKAEVEQARSVLEEYQALDDEINSASRQFVLNNSEMRANAEKIADLEEQLTDMAKTYDQTYGNRTLEQAQQAVQTLMDTQEALQDYVSGTGLKQQAEQGAAYSEQQAYECYQILDGYLAKYQIMEAEQKILELDPGDPQSEDYNAELANIQAKINEGKALVEAGQSTVRDATENYVSYVQQGAGAWIDCIQGKAGEGILEASGYDADFWADRKAAITSNAFTAELSNNAQTITDYENTKAVYGKLYEGFSNLQTFIAEDTRLTDEIGLLGTAIDVAETQEEKASLRQQRAVLEGQQTTLRAAYNIGDENGQMPLATVEGLKQTYGYDEQQGVFTNLPINANFVTAIADVEQDRTDAEIAAHVYPEGTLPLIAGNADQSVNLPYVNEGEELKFYSWAGADYYPTQAEITDTASVSDAAREAMDATLHGAQVNAGEGQVETIDGVDQGIAGLLSEDVTNAAQAFADQQEEDFNAIQDLSDDINDLSKENTLLAKQNTELIDKVDELVEEQDQLGSRKELEEDLENAQQAEEDAAKTAEEAADKVDETKAELDQAVENYETVKDLTEQLQEAEKDVSDGVDDYFEKLGDVQDAADEVDKAIDNCEDGEIENDEDMASQVEEYEEYKDEHGLNDDENNADADQDDNTNQGDFDGDEGGEIGDEIGEAGNPVADMGDDYIVEGNA